MTHVHVSLAFVIVSIVYNPVWAALDPTVSSASGNSFSISNSPRSGLMAPAVDGYHVLDTKPIEPAAPIPETEAVKDAKAEAEATKEKNARKKACTAATKKADDKPTPANLKAVKDACDPVDYNVKDPQDPTSQLSSSDGAVGKSPSDATSRLLSPDIEKTSNVWKEEGLDDVNILKTKKNDISQAQQAKLLSGNGTTKAFNTENFGGLEPRKVQTVATAVTEREFSPNTFVNPKTSAPGKLQDYTMATSGKNWNGLVVNKDGEAGWYAMNQKTDVRDFVPVDALKQGGSYWAKPCNGKGGFGDHRAAAGNLGDHAHAGNDWMNDKGEAIYSNVTGEVTDIGKGSGNFGNRVWIKSADGTITQATAHMDGFNTDLKVGDKVTAGDYIGTVGNSGAEWSGDHLHIELRNASTGGLGTPMDPTKVTASIYNDTSSLTNWMSGSSVGGFNDSTGIGGNYGTAVASAGNYTGGGTGGGSTLGGSSLGSAVQGVMNQLGFGGNVNSSTAGISNALASLLVQKLMGNNEEQSETTSATATDKNETTGTTATTDIAKTEAVKALVEKCGGNMDMTADALMLMVESCQKISDGVTETAAAVEAAPVTDGAVDGTATETPAAEPALVTPAAAS